MPVKHDHESARSMLRLLMFSNVSAATVTVIFMSTESDIEPAKKHTG